MNLICTHSTDLHFFKKPVLDDRDILWISDSISYTSLDALLNKSGHPKYIINDNNFGHHTRSIYSIPLFLETQIKAFRKLHYSQQTQSDFCFNFIINKKSANRSLLLKLVDCFQLSTKNYTWSGVSTYFDMHLTLEELNDPACSLKTDIEDYDRFLKELLSPCKTPPKIIEYPNQTVTDISIHNYGGNVWTWCNGLSEIFSKTSVSLISESVEYQKVSCVTEKTGYSILGLTFPIWIGGYGTPDAWQTAGLDIFSDVVDHSYQYKETLIERCYYAFKNNLRLLTDLEFSQKQRDRCQSRLLENRQKLLDGILTDYCYDTVDGWPDELKDICKSMIPKIYAGLLIGIQ